MNRKQRRIAQAQNQYEPRIDLNGKSYTIAQACTLAVQAHGLKQFQAAIDIFNLVLAKAPHAEAYNNRGLILQAVKRYAEALVDYDRAIALKPGLVEAHNNRAITLKEMRRYDEALASFDKAIGLKPDLAQAHNNKANALLDMKRYEEALVNYDNALALKPDLAAAHQNRGNALLEMKRYDEALISLNKAIALQPDLPEAHQNRGNVLRTLRYFDEALACYEQAAAIDPNLPYILGDVLYTKSYLCNWHGQGAVFDKLIAGVEAGKPVSKPFPLVTTPASPLQQRKCAEISIRNKYSSGASPLWKGEIYTHDKIRIGYFSADFHNHATSHLMAKLFELHDRSKFEITGFSFGLSPADDMRARLEKSFDRFIDVSSQSDAQIARLARNMEIDIAVDLKGFTKDSRTGIFALRPAPVQVNYLGYPGTMGAGYIDYIIADQIIIPEEHKPYYAEKIVYLPDSYQVNDSSRRVSDKVFTRRELGLPEEGIVFCCFNDNYKITSEVFAIWMRLLHEVPGSVLWLFAGNPTAVKNLCAEAESKGIAENRLVFASRMDLPDHLARHKLADVFLDTFPCNAHTTASDALWTGLPVLTYLDQTFAGRVAASLLTAVGLPELITHSHADYEALALDLATHPDKLFALKAKLVQNRETRPLFNTALFAKRIEAAYIRMWEKSQAGAAPDHINIIREGSTS